MAVASEVPSTFRSSAIRPGPIALIRLGIKELLARRRLIRYLVQADLKRQDLQLPDPPATLQAREIEMVVDFLIAKVVGKGPMDRARCIEYWGSEVDACKAFPN